MAEQVIIVNEDSEMSTLVQEEEAVGDQHQLLPPPTCWFGPDESKDESTGDPSEGSYLVDSTYLTENRTADAASPPPDMSSIATTPTSSITTQPVVGGAPSWKELSSQVLPAAAQELLSTSMRRVCYTARVSWASRRWQRKHSDLGMNVGGYFLTETMMNKTTSSLPRFSSLPWVDRQLVQEWRTVAFQQEEESDAESAKSEISEIDSDEEEEDFDRARTLVPKIHPRPKWSKADACCSCHKPFGPTLLRHHCRLCGNSYCQSDSSWTHRLPHLGYDPEVPERVCDVCKRQLIEENLAERVAWRLARCRDFFNDNLTPYFETGVDTVEDAAMRITTAAIAMARKIPLGAQAHVAVETVEVLRRHGLKGIYTLILRKEFLEAADLLCRALGINKTAWPLSVHELSAAIFYALAQHRAMRGMNPEREHLIHTHRKEGEDFLHDEQVWTGKEQEPNIAEESAELKTDLKPMNSGISDNSEVIDETDAYNPMLDSVANYLALADKTPPESTKKESEAAEEEDLQFAPVCDPVPDAVVGSLLFYAPIALHFVYAEREVEMQLLAAQQGWRLIYAHLEQDPDSEGPLTDRPAYAMFAHPQQKIACLAVRGTATINDVVTDIRQVPVPFPETECDIPDESSTRIDDDWTPIFRGQGLAVCGMARAALNLYRENIDALAMLVQQGYRIRITGHSLGGGVATLLGALVLRHIEQTASLGDTLRKQSNLVHVYGYGTPSCVDARLSEYVKSFVTTAVLHDDVVPRLTPTSIRGLLKHLLHIRETWVKVHLADDLIAITERAKTVWAPQWRHSFTLSSSVSLKRYCRKQIQYGHRKLLSVKGKLVGSERFDESNQIQNNTSGTEDWVSETIVICEPKSTEISMEVLEEEVLPLDDVSDQDPGPTMLVDYMGGVDVRAEAVVVDGDAFFDTEDTLIESDGESSAEDSEVSRDDMFRVSSPTPEAAEMEASEVSSPVTEDDSWVPFDDHVERRGSGGDPGSVSTESEASFQGEEQDEESPSPSAVMLEETPLPRMFLPGKIIHIYTHRGGYKASFVPRSFRELRRISLAGNMLSDHTTKAYYEALLEIRTVRSAEEGLPRWTAFDEDHTCSCCASRFTWASTSDTEAQEARDKHNCRSCGTLVCDPCSKNRIPLPSIGITVAARVCDRCYNDIGGVLTGDPLRSSFVEETGISMSEASRANNSDASLSDTAKIERQRERRSHVVDELAACIQQSTVTCS